MATKKVFQSGTEAQDWVDKNCAFCSISETCTSRDNVANALTSLELQSTDVTYIGVVTEGDDWAALLDVCQENPSPKEAISHEDTVLRSEPDQHPAEAVSYGVGDVKDQLDKMNAQETSGNFKECRFLDCSYYNSGSVSGALQIKFPYTCSNTNYFELEFMIRNDTDGSISQYLMTGKLDSDGFDTMGGHRLFIRQSSSPIYTSSFQFLTNISSKAVIEFGLFSDSHTGLSVKLNRFKIWGDATDVSQSWESGWEIAFDNSFHFPSGLGFTKEKIWTEGSDGVGSGLDADYFGGLQYQKYIYGSDTRAMRNMTGSDYDNANDRNEFMYGDNVTNAPGTYAAGNPWSSLINIALANAASYNWQLGIQSRFDKLYLRREYAGWQSWVQLLSENNIKFKDLNKTSDYTLNHYESSVNLDASSNAVDISLTDSSIDGMEDGKIQQVNCIDSTYLARVKPSGSDTINGSSYIVLFEGDSIMFKLTGTTWRII